MKASVRQLKPYIPEKPLATLQAELGLSKLVRLSANENPYGTSPAVEKAVKQWDFAGSNRYPDAEAEELRQAVAQRYQLNPDSLVFSVGLDEMIVMLTRTWLAPGDQVMVSTPTFSEYGLHSFLSSIMSPGKVIRQPTSLLVWALNAIPCHPTPSWSGSLSHLWCGRVREAMVTQT